MRSMNKVFADLPVTVFEAMSQAARDNNAINLGQGFPDDPGPEDIRRAAADASLNGIGSDGLIYGNPEQLLKQFVAVVAVIVYVSIVSFVLLKIVNALFGLRAPEDAEVAGLDLSLHGETAYQM